jgi:hypothetical protein
MEDRIGMKGRNDKGEEEYHKAKRKKEENAIREHFGLLCCMQS